MGILDKVLKSFLGDKNQKDLNSLYKVVDGIKEKEPDFSSLTIDELRAKTKEFKSRLAEATEHIRQQIHELRIKINETDDFNLQDEYYNEIDALEEDAYDIEEQELLRILPEAFVVIKETAKRFKDNESLTVKATEFDRKLSGEKDYVQMEGEDKVVWSNSWDAAGKEVTWDMVHYDVQFIGGVVLHQGKIAEMATGEGKTLVATLPVYLNALPGRGVHVVTVNDYLAKRDAAWMAPIFEFHGLSVDCIDNYQPNSLERKEAYKADITYGTNNEFGFDYLRDNMTNNPDLLVQRKHNYAIIDEVDSVLIDDARTPLIISGPVPQGDRQEYDTLKPNVAKLVEKQRGELHKTFQEAKKLIQSGNTKEGGKLLFTVYRGMPKYKPLIKFLSEEGNRTLLNKTEGFYIADNEREMPAIDKNLYYSIEEKSNQIQLTDKGIAELTDEFHGENFFVLPDIGEEVAKIEKKNLSKEEETQEKEELYRDFAIKSDRIHTLNQLLKAYTLFEKDVEYVVMDGEVKIVDEQTGRVMDGRRYSDGLHQAIEAKENVKVEDATQTFATVTLQNYFRMYRKLSGMTGTAETEAGEFWEIYKLDVVVIPTNKPIARDDRQDLVYKTTKEKFNAVIEEIERLSKDEKRPVLVGTISVEISEILSKMLTLRKIPHQVLNAKLHKKEADVVAEAGRPGVVTIATNMAGRGTDIKINDEVKKAGGLAIIGTERHDSRRVDRQLRGRAGRQGDVGSSQFYVSLEDDLMRKFGSERISKVMDRMGHQEGDVIQHSMISKSIERAQKKVEENNFGTRKRLIEYDDVMNKQREVIYKRRRNALHGDRLNLDIANMIMETTGDIVAYNKAQGDFKSFEMDLITRFTMDSPVTESEFNSSNVDLLTEKVYLAALEDYKNKLKSTAEKVYPVISNVYENQGSMYKNIQVPFTDGSKVLNVVSDLERAYETKGESLLKDFEKGITLAIIDENWKEHLREMDDMKKSVQSTSYIEQKDPIVIYKQESFELFSQMLDKVNRDITSFLFKGELPTPDPDQIQQAKEQQRVRTQEGRSLEQDRQNYNDPSQRQPAEKVAPRQVTKINRNARVNVRNIQTGEKKEMKFKQAEKLIDRGQWVLVED